MSSTWLEGLQSFRHFSSEILENLLGESLSFSLPMMIIFLMAAIYILSNLRKLAFLTFDLSSELDYKLDTINKKIVVLYLKFLRMKKYHQHQHFFLVEISLAGERKF